MNHTYSDSQYTRSEEKLREYIKKHHLYAEDASRVSIQEHKFYGTYRVIITKTFDISQSQRDGDEEEYTIPDLKSAKNIHSTILHMLKEREHPYQHDMDNFLKPLSLLELQVFIGERGNVSSHFIVAGPDNKVDRNIKSLAKEFKTSSGTYVVPNRDSDFFRSLHQGPIFIPDDPEQPYIMGEDLFVFASNDLIFCRSFTEAVISRTEPLYLEANVKTLQSNNNAMLLKFESLRESFPWRPQLREQMPELTGPSGYIPYTSILPPLHINKINCDQVLGVFWKHDMPLNDTQIQYLAIQAKEELLDSYEIGAIIERNDADLLDTMIARNNEFYAMKRAYQAAESMDYLESKYIPKDDQLRIQSLHQSGFIDFKEVARIHNAYRYGENPKQSSACSDELLRSLEKVKDFYLGNERGSR